MGRYWLLESRQGYKANQIRSKGITMHSGLIVRHKSDDQIVEVLQSDRLPSAARSTFETALVGVVICNSQHPCQYAWTSFIYHEVTTTTVEFESLFPDSKIYCFLLQDHIKKHIFGQGGNLTLLHTVLPTAT